MIDTARILSHAVSTAVVEAPAEAVDIADWLLNLPDDEYDGRPVSINVKQIGSALVVQHYGATVTEKDHCHLLSTSDVLTPSGWTTCRVSWCLQVDAIDESTSAYINTVTVWPTEEFLEFIAVDGQTFAEAAVAWRTVSGEHCRRRTALFAASIERRTLRSRARDAQHVA